MKKLSLFLAVGALACLSGSARAQDFKPTDTPPALQREDIIIKSMSGARHVFHVELALGPVDQERGLMFRTKLPPTSGMLFAFPSEAEQEFWMKNTLIPLDMLFIEKTGVIHRIATAKANDLTPVPSKGAVLAVLELNGGMAQKLGIKEGDKVLDKQIFKNAP